MTWWTTCGKCPTWWTTCSWPYGHDVSPCSVETVADLVANKVADKVAGKAAGALANAVAGVGGHVAMV